VGHLTSTTEIGDCHSRESGNPALSSIPATISVIPASVCVIPAKAGIHSEESTQTLRWPQGDNRCFSSSNSAIRNPQSQILHLGYFFADSSAGLYPSAFSLQPSAFSLSFTPSAFSLGFTDVGSSLRGRKAAAVSNQLVNRLIPKKEGGGKI